MATIVDQAKAQMAKSVESNQGELLRYSHRSCESGAA